MPFPGFVNAIHYGTWEPLTEPSELLVRCWSMLFGCHGGKFVSNLNLKGVEE